MDITRDDTLKFIREHALQVRKCQGNRAQRQQVHEEGTFFFQGFGHDSPEHRAKLEKANRLLEEHDAEAEKIILDAFIAQDEAEYEALRQRIITLRRMRAALSVKMPETIARGDYDPFR